jgi:hypothetical protein
MSESIYINGKRGWLNSPRCSGDNWYIDGIDEVSESDLAEIGQAFRCTPVAAVQHSPYGDESRLVVLLLDLQVMIVLDDYMENLQ